MALWSIKPKFLMDLGWVTDRFACPPNFFDVRKGGNMLRNIQVIPQLPPLSPPGEVYAVVREGRGRNLYR
jgi:hypothetical protein